MKAIWNGAMNTPVLAALFFFYLTEHLFSSIKNWLREKSCFLSKLQIIVQGKSQVKFKKRKVYSIYSTILLSSFPSVCHFQHLPSGHIHGLVIPTFSPLPYPQILIYFIHWAWSENCEEKRTAFIRISMFDSLNYECSVAQLRLTLCDPMDCSLPGSVHSILQARILKWVAILFSRISS